MTGIASGDQTEGEMLRSVGLWRILSEDFRTHQRGWSKPGLRALWVHRIGVYIYTLRRPFRIPLKPFYHLAHIFCRNVYGIELEHTVHVGRRLIVGHQHGIVIHKFARIGDDCVIRQGVTMGIGTEWVPHVGPTIGNSVEFGAGAMVVGNITIGDNVSIGPNCVVMNDVPSDRSLFVSPPRALPKQTEVADLAEEKAARQG